MSDTSLRSDYPIKFNTTEILFPLSWEESPAVIEQVFMTEAGTDKVEVTRMSKLSIAASFKCTDQWVATFGAFSRLTSFTLKRYNPSNSTYEEKVVRMRDFKYALVPKSEDLTATKGVWEVSFSLEEF